MSRVDFKNLKARVSMADAISRYPVRLRKVNDHAFKARCPLPSHTSKASEQSFFVDTGKNVWCCHSDSCKSTSGRHGGDIFHFVSLMEGCTVREAARKLSEWFPSGYGVAEKKEPAPSAVEGNTPLAFELKGITYHKFLKSRGISEETAKKFGVGFFPGRGSMASRIVIPMHNEKSELVGYAGRALNGDEPKYKLPAGFEKSKVLYNLNRVWDNEDVFLVEGFFDSIKLCSLGVASVALIGSSIAPHQVELLKRFRRVIVMLDGDEAGQNCTPLVAGLIADHCFVRSVMLPAGKQPSNLTQEELSKILREVNFFDDWRRAE